MNLSDIEVVVVRRPKNHDKIKKLIKILDDIHESTEEEIQRWDENHMVYLKEKKRLKRVKRNRGKHARRRHK